MEIYERNINTSVSREDENYVVTKASLLDLNHNMRVEIKVDIRDRRIVEARAQMLKTPFKVCKQTATLVKRLEDLKIERGVTKTIARELGRSHGCTHLFELAVEAVRLTSNVLLGFEVGDEEWRERKLSDEQFIEHARDFLADSCLPFKVND